jgi:hypothetical protein
MTKRRVEKRRTQKPKPLARGKQYPGAHGKVVDWVVPTFPDAPVSQQLSLPQPLRALYRKRNRPGCHELPAVQPSGAGCTADAFTYCLVNVGRVVGIENDANHTPAWEVR